jgi:hypothetical protein
MRHTGALLRWILGFRHDPKVDGGDGGIRTLDTPLQTYNGLANRRLQPLGHVSGAPIV